MKPIFLQAAIAFEAPIGAEGLRLPRRFSGVAYSGGLVPRWESGIVIDLATLSVQAPLPLFHQHDPTSAIGTVQEVTNDGRALGSGGELFSDFDPVAEGIAKRAQRGLPYQQSIGLYQYSEEEVKPGATVSVNGQTFTGPVTILRNGMLREISICPLGADSNTNASFFQAHPMRPTPDEATPMADDPNAAKVAELTAEVNGLRQSKSEQSRRADEAEARVVALTAERDTLAARLTAAHAEQVKALFAETGRQYSEEAAAPYIAMTADSFALIAADMRALKARNGAVDSALFTEQATGPTSGDKKVSLSVVDIYAARRNAAQGK